MAGVAIHGAFRELEKLAKGFEELAGPAKRKMFSALAEAAKTEIQLSFEEGRDPYGAPWRPPVARPGGRPLRDTGRLMNSFNTQATSSGFEVRTNVGYAAAHNYGVTIKAKSGKPLKFQVPGGWRSKYSVTIPKRQFIPTPGKLGKYWTSGLQDAARVAMHRIVGR